MGIRDQVVLQPAPSETDYDRLRTLAERAVLFDSLVVAVVTVITTSVTLTNTDVVALVDDDTAGGAVTINLPPAAENAGRILHVKKLGTTGNVIIDGNASETIDGATTQVITTQFDSARMVCDGSNWFII